MQLGNCTEESRGSRSYVGVSPCSDFRGSFYLSQLIMKGRVFERGSSIFNVKTRGNLSPAIVEALEIFRNAFREGFC